ncbi:hypothetical protein [Asticcacaulis solisilvae]|uniref:hypothetical protein n=1 Tax=Asticcacaulis solisilvae TaxID=1217274 RepID=UPI003FD8A6EB
MIKTFLFQLFRVCAGLIAAALLPAAVLAAEPIPRAYIVGQDFGSVRDYYLSQCCVRPDGVTTYLGFYDLFDPHGFGGLGVDEHNRPAADADWGAGVTSAYKSVTGLPVSSVAIGLSIAEAGHRGGLKRIADGTFDAEIDHLARFFKASDKTILLRIGYEFDGPWNDGYDNAPAYVAAFRHIVDRMRAQGVGNVRYVWQASCSPLASLIRGRRIAIDPWYPGDAYVDVAAMSWFLDPDRAVPAKNGFTAPTQGALRDELVAFAAQHDKPVMIAESTPQGYDLKAEARADITRDYDGKPGEGRTKLSAVDIWSQWYQPLFDYLAAHPEVRILAYINADWDAQAMWGKPYSNGYWGDSRLQDNPAIATRWNAAVTRWKAQP